MDSKKEIEIGDYAQYNDGSGVVLDEDGVPLVVIEISHHSLLGDKCVFYNNGSFSFLKDVEKATPLMRELV